MKQLSSSIFRAYDIRGIYPSEFDEDAAYAIARGYAAAIRPDGPVALGRDVRTSSPALHAAVLRGLTDAGVDVVDIGMISTDMLFFAVGSYGYGGGITVTASHNPKEYNGMKMVRRGSVAISEDTGIRDIQREAEVFVRRPSAPAARPGSVSSRSIIDDYVAYLRGFADLRGVHPYTIVANANNGMSGIVLEKLVVGLPLRIIPMHFDPDGTFPGGSPDPMTPAARAAMSAAVREHGADFGVAWDADADRCVFWDGAGDMVEGYYTTAILAGIMLHKHRGERILHDPRLTWAIIDAARAAGGIPTITKVGSSFIKNRMHDEGFLFAGEASGHYYFRDYFCADNGMLPFLLMLEHLSGTGATLKDIADRYRERYPAIPERNYTVADPAATLARIGEAFSEYRTEHIDGISVEADTWRFNVRKSNTEPLVRLNAEAKTPTELQAIVDRVSAIISGAELRLRK